MCVQLWQQHLHFPLIIKLPDAIITVWNLELLVGIWQNIDPYEAYLIQNRNKHYMKTEQLVKMELKIFTLDKMPLK